jgi:predicted naringenin-chalcone synthase
MSSRIIAVATAVPRYRLDAREALAQLRRFWPRLERLEETDAALGTRFTCEPVEQLLRPRGLSELRCAYLEHGRELTAAAARKALQQARVQPSEIDMVVSVSCTGYVVPALDVYLAAELGLRPDILRLPITELGCSGGAAAIGIAHRQLQGFPEQKVLVVAVELPSLSFQAGDGSLDNLTASLVFGDGAGAAVVAGSDGKGGLQLVKAASHLVPDTAGLLGFDLRDDGFHVVLDRRLPRVLANGLRAVVDEFLAPAGLGDLDFVAAHAGGPRIFEAVESALQLSPEALDVSRHVFAETGNTSSAAIFFTLERLLESLGERPARGLGLGFGPGISIELMQLAWAPLENAGQEAGSPGEGAPVRRRRLQEALLGADAVEQDGGVQG